MASPTPRYQEKAICCQTHTSSTPLNPAATNLDVLATQELLFCSNYYFVVIICRLFVFQKQQMRHLMIYSSLARSQAKYQCRVRLAVKAKMFYVSILACCECRETCISGSTLVQSLSILFKGTICQRKYDHLTTTYFMLELIKKYIHVGICISLFAGHTWIHC